MSLRASGRAAENSKSAGLYLGLSMAGEIVVDIPKLNEAAESMMNCTMSSDLWRPKEYLKTHVDIGTPHSIRPDTHTFSSSFGPRTRFHWNYQFALLPWNYSRKPWYGKESRTSLTFRVWVVELDVRDDASMFKRKHCFHNTR